MNEKSISLKDILIAFGKLRHYLWSKWLLILFCGLLGGAIGLICSFIIKPVYTASTTFVLEEDKAGSGGLSSLAGLASVAGLDLGIGGGGSLFQGDNILELYRSRTMIEKTLLTTVDYRGKKMKLVERYINFKNLREKWDDPGLKSIQFDPDTSGNERNFSRLQDSVLGKISSDINENYLSVTKPDKKLTIIRVDVTSKDEFFAEAFNKGIVKNVNDFYIKTRIKKSLQNVTILQHKTDSVRAVMNGAIYSAAAVSDATPNLNPTRQIQRTAPVQRSQFSVETNKLMLSELIKNLELSKISLVKETPLIQVIDQPVLPLQKDRLGKAKGIVFGGIIAGILVILFLTIRIFLKKLISE
jgi:hypothetical protein